MHSAEHLRIVIARPMLRCPHRRQCGFCTADHSGRHGASEDPSGDIGRLHRPDGEQRRNRRSFRDSDSWKGSHMKFNKKAAAAVAAGAVVVAGSGVAFAFWTSAGDGTGTATTSAGNAAAFTVAGDVPNAMFPGDTAQTV